MPSEINTFPTIYRTDFGSREAKFYSMAIDRAGRYLFAACDDRFIRVFDLLQRRRVQELMPYPYDPYYVKSLAIYGNRLYAVRENGELFYTHFDQFGNLGQFIGLDLHGSIAKKTVVDGHYLIIFGSTDGVGEIKKLNIRENHRFEWVTFSEENINNIAIKNNIIVKKTRSVIHVYDLDMDQLNSELVSLIYRPDMDENSDVIIHRNLIFFNEKANMIAATYGGYITDRCNLGYDGYMTCLAAHNNYIYAGCSDGSIRRWERGSTQVENHSWPNR